ncbi:MAG: SUMF1/EgtB/PvdO family nonheme iron enzyme [Anaerolineae bacterium]
MELSSLTTAALREDLRALRYHKPLHASPLMASALARQRLAAEGAQDTPQAREWAVGELLREVIGAELEQLRGGAATKDMRSADRGRSSELAQLRQDFQADRKDLEAWALVAHYYLSLEPLQLQELADTLGLVEKTMQRRLARGHELVAVAFRTREIKAQARLAQEAEQARAAQPADRVRAVLVAAAAAVSSESGSNAATGASLGTVPHALLPSTTEAAAALLTAIRGDGAVHLREDILREIARQPVGDLQAYRLACVATWSLPRYALDRRFVALTLLLDQGEQAAERWSANSERYEDLRAVLAPTRDPALVLLGAPGSGKSTLLRRLEMDLAAEALRGDGDTVTFFVRLAGHKPAAVAAAPPAPLDWLAAEWSARYPDLPPLTDLLGRRPVLLLLDGLNEMPHDSPRVYHQRVGAWRSFLQELATRHPGTRVLISCRSLDYSAPLSSPALRVPQVQVEPLDDAQIQAFLERHLGTSGLALWKHLVGTLQLDVLRVPYFLRLLADQAEAGEPPTGRAALFTGFVRQGLRRELERGNPLFLPDGLLTERDCARLTSAQQWRTEWELPERGKLVPKLAALARGMQELHRAAAGAQARLPYDAALDLLDDPQDEQILRAGTAITVLDDDREQDEVGFFHQLLQEYFAARALAKAPQPALVATFWRAEDIRPSVPELLATLEPSETLPPLPQTGWEETTLMAVAMAAEPNAHVAALMVANLALAGRAAGQVEVVGRLDAELLERLKWALVERSRSAEADLRDRIACAYAVGDLGDPRWERRVGPYGEYLMPPMVRIPAGLYSIGADEAIAWEVRGSSGVATAHIPRHDLLLHAFSIGVYPVTNAEWRRFMDAGGYADEQWWDTADALRWVRGDLSNQGGMSVGRFWRQRFLADGALLTKMAEEGGFPDDSVRERWMRWLTLDEVTFETELEERWRGRRYAGPEFFDDARYNRALQPVVGVTWYESRAYCSWLAAQTGQPFRLPTEVEWEVAAVISSQVIQGAEADDQQGSANTVEMRLRGPSPVGSFANGRHSAVIADASGNVYEWTTSLWGEYLPDDETPGFSYPYAADDGREDLAASPSAARIARGGSWGHPKSDSKAYCRDPGLADSRSPYGGFRVAMSESGSRD